MLKPHHLAIVFDCDGTLADSMPAHWIAWETMLTRHGLDHLMPFERFMSLGGVPARRIFEMLAEESGRTLDAPTMAAQKYDAYFDAIHHVTPIAPTVELARSQRGKLPMAVATGSTRKGVTWTLEAIDALDWFDAIITADDVAHPKPHPETFTRAAHALRIAPEDCLAFEDTDLGIASATDAGMDVIDVRTLF